MSVISILTFLFVAWLVAIWQLRDRFLALKEKIRHTIVLFATLLFTALLTESIMLFREDVFWTRLIVYIISFFIVLITNLYVVRIVEKSKS
jgi:predicted membrane metal-binding protein